MKIGLEIGCVTLFVGLFFIACSNFEGYSSDSIVSTEFYSSLVYEAVEVPLEVQKDTLPDSLAVKNDDEPKDSVNVGLDGDLKDSAALVEDKQRDSTDAKKDKVLPAEPKDSVITLDSAACAEIRSTKNDFVPLEYILPCVKENEKVAFIVRHGAREPFENGTEDHLNEMGVMQAFRLGEKLKAYPDFYYMHSYYIRTMETAYYVAQGKGQKVDAFTRENSDTLVHEMTDDLLYNWYVKDYAYEYVCSPNGGLASLTKMAYETEDYYCNLGFYNAKERTLEFVKKYFTYNRMYKATFAVTHDYFVAPMVIAITDGEIGMDYYNHSGDYYYWPNFLSGAAVIVDDKDNVTMVPVKGLESGRLETH